jgi:hypothetical protein
VAVLVKAAEAMREPLEVAEVVLVVLELPQLMRLRGREEIPLFKALPREIR